MKTCTKCRTPKSLDEFVKDKRRSDGRGSWCLSCNREYMRAIIQTPKVAATRQASYEANKEALNAASRARWAEKKDVYKVAGDAWRMENREALLADYRDRGVTHRGFIDEQKAGRSCLDCGGSFPPYVIKYDHVRGGKRWALGKMSNHRREAVLEELAKCELVCCACHRVRTQARNTHGEHTGRYRELTRTRLTQFHEWVNMLKANPCLDCGKVLRPEAMDFDHVRGDKVQSISSMWSWGRAKVEAEIAKCELVCANCHRVRMQVWRVPPEVPAPRRGSSVTEARV